MTQAAVQLSVENVQKRKTVSFIGKLLLMFSIAALVFGFVPSMNPVRISPDIYQKSTQRNVHTDWALMETTGSYLWRLIGTNHVNQEKNLTDAQQFRLFIYSILLQAGIWTDAICGLVTIKFRKRRRGAAKAALYGAVAQFVGLLGILIEYFLLYADINAEGVCRLTPVFPAGILLYTALAAACLVLALKAIALREPKGLRELLPAPPRKLSVILRREGELWVIAGIAILYMLLFVYLPMLGNVIGFLNFKVKKGGFIVSILKSEWRGLWQFRRFFAMANAWNAIRNTLVMGTLNITVGFIAPIILALLMNEIRHTAFKRITQTISYLPHFVSWVVVASIAMTIFGNDSGILNNALRNFEVIPKDSYVPFLDTGKWYWGLITSLNIWKGIGWGTIIYISAITGIDQQLYEAGAVDGLGRAGMVWHITLPGIKTTIMMLFILGTAGIISGGFEQHLLLGNLHTVDYYETIDTFVYRYFSGTNVTQDYSLSNAVGFLTSGIAILLLIITNTIMRKMTDMSLF